MENALKSFTTEEMEVCLIESLKDITLREELHSGTTLGELSLDSLDVLELFFRLQSFLGTEITQEDMQKFLLGEEENMQVAMQRFSKRTIAELAETLQSGFEGREALEEQLESLENGLELWDESQSQKADELLNWKRERHKTLLLKIRHLPRSRTFFAETGAEREQELLALMRQKGSKKSWNLVRRRFGNELLKLAQTGGF